MVDTGKGTVVSYCHYALKGHTTHSLSHTHTPTPTPTLTHTHTKAYPATNTHTALQLCHSICAIAIICFNK